MTVILVCNHIGPPYVPVMTPDCQVTGASGFIGSHVVDQLLKDGYFVRGYVYCYAYTLHSTLTKS